jgi:hypothetical protein
LILPPGATGPSGADGSAGLVYLGDYVSGNGYVSNIAVVKGSDNNLYIATSSGGLGDPVGNTAEWSVFLPKGADGATGPTGSGFRSRGIWSNPPMDGLDNFYAINDVVTYLGSSYLSVGDSYGSPPISEGGNGGTNTGWLTFASKGVDGAAGEGFNYLGEYSSATSYTENDVVTFHNTTFILPTGSNAGQAPIDAWGTPLEPWDILVPTALNFRGEYDPANEGPGVGYVNGDVVTYNGSTYVVDPKGDLPVEYNYRLPDSESTDNNWTLLSVGGVDGAGFNWRGTWSNMANPSYVAADVVEYEGSTYLCTPQMTPIMNYPPVFGPSSPTPGPNPDWELMSSAGEGFNWRGTWTNMTPPGESYVANDVVSYNGSLYLAKAAGPNAAGTGTPDMYGNGGWVLMTQGFNWRGAWSSNPMGAYGVGDLVSYQGSVYLGVNNMGSPPSGTPGESMNYSWQVFVGSTAPKWRGEWSMMPTPSYVVNDLVSYNGSAWIAVPGSMNMGVMGTPGSSDSWEVFTSSFRFRGNWMSNPMDTLGAYVDNDVVSYQGSTYIAKDNMNDAGVGTPGESLPDNGGTSGWKLMASAGEGFVWKGGWQEPMPSMPYVEGDVVSYNSKIYVAKTPFMMSYEPGSGTPGEMGAGWELMLSAFNWRGAWIQDESPMYALNDVVEYNGSSYIVTGGDSTLPPVSEGGSVNSGWSLLAAKGDTGDSINWRGEWSETLDPAPAANDAFSYNGSSYVLVSPQLFTPAPADEQGNANTGWLKLAAKGEDGESLNWRGAWDEFADPAYQDNDVIFYEGSSYVGQQIGAGNWSQPPGSNNDYWSLLAAKGEDGGFGASASYHSRVDQGPQASANLVQAFTFNTTDWQTGILRADNTKIGMLSAGKYNIAFSAQLYQTSGSGTVNIWLNKNGSPMAYTNTKVVVESNAPYKVAAWNFFVDAAANDYYEIMWSSSSTNTVIEYDPAQTINGNLHPEIPSIIVTVNQVG